MYGIGNEPFGQQDQADGVSQAWADWTGRVEAMQYNIAVQRGDQRSAAGALARMLGNWLANRWSR
jgi:hypothetical protein